LLEAGAAWLVRGGRGVAGLASAGRVRCAARAEHLVAGGRGRIVRRGAVRARCDVRAVTTISHVGRP
jgi:hypothetical protein